MKKQSVTVKLTNTIRKQLESYFKAAGIKPGDKSEGADRKARVEIALSLLNFCVNGSANDSTVAPIMTGNLRGSGSAFLGSEAIGDLSAQFPTGEQVPSISAKPNEITVGFNTPYAARLHETEWVPGGKKPSKQATTNPNITGDVGNKWLEKQLNANRDNFIEYYAKTLKSETGA